MKRYLIGGATLLLLSACATKPEAVQEIIQSAPAPIERPQAVTPAPAPTPLPPIVQSAPSEGFIDNNSLFNLPTPGSVEDFAYQSGGEPRVFFGYNEYRLSAEAQDILRRQADWMNVKDFLVSQGVSPTRLRTISYGKERPIDSSPSEAGWARNRNGYTNLRLFGFS